MRIGIMNGKSESKSRSKSKIKIKKETLSQFTDPNISEADRVAMILKIQRALLSHCFERGGCRGHTFNGNMILNEHAIVQHGEGARLDLTIGELFGCVEDNIIDLPFTRFARCIDQGCFMPIKRAALAVRIRFVLVRVQHLNLVTAHEIDAAIAAALAVAFHNGGRRPFDVQLTVSKFLL